MMNSLAGQPCFSYVHACAYDKWAEGIRAEKHVWAISTGFRATEINVRNFLAGN